MAVQSVTSVRDRCERLALCSACSIASQVRSRAPLRKRASPSIASAGAALVLTGTVIFTLGEGWNIVDGFYFAVATLTTSSIADPDLVLTHDVLKIFTALYVLTGIGILVEVARQLGVGFVKMRDEYTATIPRQL